MQDPAFVIPLLPKAQLDAIQHKHLDVPYCNRSENQVLDIFLPDHGKKPYPVILHVHGGAFMIGTQRDDNLEPMLRALDRGYAVVSMQYRRSGEARFPAFVFDAKAAVRFIRSSAEEYGFDPDRIAAWGPSSGGYVVAMLGVTANNPAFEDLSQGNAEYSSAVSAVVDWCGPCGDFCRMDDDLTEDGLGPVDHNAPDSPESCILGAPIQTVSELSLLAAPYRYATKNAPPFLIQHGGADPVVPVQQSMRLAEALRTAGADVTLEIYDGKGHHCTPWYNETWLSDRVLNFLDKKLARNECNG